MGHREHLTPLRAGAGRSGAPGRHLRVALIVPFGEPRRGYFPDTLFEHACGRLRAAGHEAHLLRVYYDGREAARDEEVRGRLAQWLALRAPELVVVERLFDPEPLRAYREREPDARVLLVSWGDTDLVPGVDWLAGLSPGRVRGGRSRRSPSAGELLASIEMVAEHMARGAEPDGVPGIARVVADSLVSGPEPRALPIPLPIVATLEHETIALDEAPMIRERHLFGNAGCPFALDPRSNPFYDGVRWPEDVDLAGLGCTFCHLGGDYQKRPDAEVIASVVAQAHHYVDAEPALEALVLVDQYPVRYLTRLLQAAHEAGIRPVRWLFQARADGFVRDLPHLRAAVAVAARVGHRVEVYLSGFESFSDRELERYNKGVSARGLVDAVAHMRALRRDAPDTFEYARARGHSMILWSPWTEPRDLRDNIQAVRAHGLMELFDELGRNRLRLYSDLPVWYAAERDGLLLDEWPRGLEGAARRKGYAVDHPWRFADPRTALAYALALDLRERLGTETETDQLAAIASFCEERSAPSLRAEVARGVSDLERALASLAGPARAPLEPRPAGGVPLSPVPLSGPCNNGCRACPNRDTWRDPETPAVIQRIREARRSGEPVALVGREPTIRADFLELLREASGEDGRPVALLSNGRAFALPGFAARARDAGLRAVALKLFAPHEATADAIAREPGAYRQAGRGAQALRAAGIPTELWAQLHRRNLREAEGFADLAVHLGMRSVRVSVSLQAIGLDALDEARAGLGRLAAACARRGLALDASPLRAGTRANRRAHMPAFRSDPADQGE